MLKYIAQRIAWAIPTLFLVSLVAFFLKQAVPDDETARISGIQIDERAAYSQQYIESAYRRGAQKLNKDKPLFYFSIVPANTPKRLFTEIYPDRKDWIGDMRRYAGSRKLLDDWFDQTLSLQQALDDSGERSINLFLATDLDQIKPMLEDVIGDSDTVVLARQAQALINSLDNPAARSGWQKYLISFRWHGPANQYHLWASGIIRGSFGYSIIDGQSVSKKIGQAAKWTILMNITALLLVFIIGIPIGVWLSKEGRFFKSGVKLLLYGLYAMPVFMLATFIVLFFTTNTYGETFNIFPAVGAYRVPYDAGLGASLKYVFSILLLPIFCIVLGSLAYVAIQMRNNMQKVFESRYYMAAKARGLSHWTLIWRHAFPNAAYSMVSVFGQSIPALIGGSVVIELIFNISGMGRLLWDALFGADWPVVFAVVMLGAIFTILGQLITDILYTLIHPKVTFEKS